MTSKRFKKLIILAIVPISSLFYGMGNHFLWWDNLQGLSYLEAFHARLESSNNIPTILITNMEDGFGKLANYISARTQNKNISKRRSKGEEPLMVCRLGGTLKPDLGKGYPKELPNPNYVPNTLPIAFVFQIDIREDVSTSRRLTIKDLSFGREDVEVACSLRDLREWILESRAHRHFWFSTLLINVVAILLGLIEIFSNEKNGSPENSPHPQEDIRKSTKKG